MKCLMAVCLLPDLYIFPVVYLAEDSLKSDIICSVNRESDLGGSTCGQGLWGTEEKSWHIIKLWALLDSAPLMEIKSFALPWRSLSVKELREWKEREFVLVEAVGAFSVFLNKNNALNYTITETNHL